MYRTSKARISGAIAEEGGGMEVNEEGQGQPADVVGGCTSPEIFDQGAAILTQANGMHACYRYVGSELIKEGT